MAVRSLWLLQVVCLFYGACGSVADEDIYVRRASRRQPAAKPASPNGFEPDVLVRRAAPRRSSAAQAPASSPQLMEHGSPWHPTDGGVRRTKDKSQNTPDEPRDYFVDMSGRVATEEVGVRRHITQESGQALEADISDPVWHPTEGGVRRHKKGFDVDSSGNDQVTDTAAIEGGVRRHKRSDSDTQDEQLHATATEGGVRRHKKKDSDFPDEQLPATATEGGVRRHKKDSSDSQELLPETTTDGGVRRHKRSHSDVQDEQSQFEATDGGVRRHKKDDADMPSSFIELSATVTHGGVRRQGSASAARNKNGI